jgi:alpha-L-fucosidase
VLLLNIPPDRRGLIHENDVARLKEFGDFISKTFDHNLASGADATSSNILGLEYHPNMMLDMDMNSFWAGKKGEHKQSAIIELPKEQTFNLILLGENITFGQRVKAFSIEALINGQWVTIAEGTTIGYKRILQIERMKASQLKLNILEAKGDPLMSSFGLYYETGALN